MLHLKKLSSRPARVSFKPRYRDSDLLENYFRTQRVLTFNGLRIKTKHDISRVVAMLSSMGKAPLAP